MTKIAGSGSTPKCHGSATLGSQNYCIADKIYIILFISATSADVPQTKKKKGERKPAKLPLLVPYLASSWEQSTSESSDEVKIS
jgi:hypothetical protein